MMGEREKHHRVASVNSLSLSRASDSAESTGTRSSPPSPDHKEAVTALTDDTRRHGRCARRSGRADARNGARGEDWCSGRALLDGRDAPYRSFLASRPPSGPRGRDHLLDREVSLVARIGVPAVEAMPYP